MCTLPSCSLVHATAQRCTGGYKPPSTASCLHLSLIVRHHTSLLSQAQPFTPFRTHLTTIVLPYTVPSAALLALRTTRSGRVRYATLPAGTMVQDVVAVSAWIDRMRDGQVQFNTVPPDSALLGQ